MTKEDSKTSRFTGEYLIIGREPPSDEQIVRDARGYLTNGLSRTVLLQPLLQTRQWARRSGMVSKRRRND